MILFEPYMLPFLFFGEKRSSFLVIFPVSGTSRNLYVIPVSLIENRNLTV